MRVIKILKDISGDIKIYLFLTLLLMKYTDVDASTVIISKMYTIGKELHYTTRGTIDLVHRYQGTWFVFHGIVGGNIFQTSLDGITWSGIKTGTNSTSDELGRGCLIEGNTITKMHVIDTDPDPKIWKNELYIAEGTIYGADITWDPSQRVIPPGTGKLCTYYSDLKRDTSGRLHFSGRHYDSNNDTTEICWTRAQNPFNNSQWETPVTIVSGNPTTSGVDAHENIQLDNDEVYIIVRTNSNVYVPGSPAKFYGRHFDGTNWEAVPTELGISDGIGGSDRRMSAIFDPKENKIHLVYIDNNRRLYHRILSKPYNSFDWTTPVLVASNVFTCKIGIDMTMSPSRIGLVYGNQRASDGGRLHTGELHFKWFDGQNWEPTSLLISEPGTIHNWYPNMIRDVSGDIGIMYLKGHWNSKSHDIMFSLITYPTSSES